MPKHSTSEPRQTPITALSNGQLHRAIVSLPDRLAERDRGMQERIVFFEVPLGLDRGQHLEQLLAMAWCVNTRDWCAEGYIYNIDSARERLNEASYDSAETGELRLFETGCGGDSEWAVGPDCIHYARTRDVDIFVTPRVGARLRALLDDIEALYQAEPARRARLAMAHAQGAAA